MDNTGQLINYIVQELKRGVPEPGIRSALLQNGWPTEPVDRAFAILQQNEAGAAAQNGATLPAVGARVEPAQKPAFRVLDTEEPPKKRRSIRRIFLALLIIALLVAAGFGAYLLIARPTQPADQDQARKDTLNALAEDLTVYYAAKRTYPTLTQINDAIFESAENGFDIADYTDPAWKVDESKCKDEKGRAIFLESRDKGCFGYRVTALNGDVCNAGTKKCTRVVLSSTLDSGKPYILALDQNEREKL